MKSTVTCLFIRVLSVITIAQSPVETRAREIAALINSGDRSAVRKYVEANFSDQMRGMPMDRHLGFFSFEHDIEWSNNVFSHVLRGGPQGGGYSTIEDLLKFDQALRSGKLVNAESMKLLTSPKPELNSPNYGYGFQVDTERNIAGHGGGFTGINSNLDMYLGSGWSAIVMSNYSRGGGPVQSKMRQLIGNAK